MFASSGNNDSNNNKPCGRSEYPIRIFDPRANKSHFTFKSKLSRGIEYIMSLEIESYVMGYHDYMDLWEPKVGEILAAKCEPLNPKDIYAVAVMKNNLVVGHLKKGKSGLFAKNIGYFLRYPGSSFHVKITAEKVNLGKKQGLQVPCKIQLAGKPDFINCLREKLESSNEL